MFRLLVPLTTLAAMIAVIFVLMPVGAAHGIERPAVATSDSDQYFFRRDAVIDAPVKGNVQVYGGNADVRSTIDGDLLVIGGTASFRDAGRVTGNVVYSGTLAGEDGRIGGRIYPLTSLEGAAATMTKSAIVVSLLFVWLIAAVIVTLISGREVRFSSMEIRSSALHCFALGLVALTSFVLTAIVFSYLVPYLVGIPLLAALAVFAILTKIYGMVAVFHAIGSLVAGARSREQLAGRKWLRGDLAMVVIGVLLLGALRLVPVLGPIVWSFASVFGVGVALATKFGRREPWFLVWRPSAV